MPIPRTTMYAAPSAKEQQLVAFGPSCLAPPKSCDMASYGRMVVRGAPTAVGTQVLRQVL